MYTTTALAQKGENDDFGDFMQCCLHDTAA